MPADNHPHTPTPEDIMAYLDGEVPPELRAEIETHLQGCKECEMVADNFRRLAARAAEWTVEPAPASLRAPASRAQQPHRSRLFAWTPSRLLLAGLSGAAVLFVLATMNERRQTPARVSAAPAIDAISLGAKNEGAVDRIAGRGAGAVTRDGAAARQSAIAGVLPEQGAAVMRRPAVIRTATLQVIVKDFTPVRSAVEGVVAQSGGFIDQMTVTGDPSTARVLRGTLRVPADRLTDALAGLRHLGQVTEDTQASEDVTDQIVDLDARLASARATEQRLTELLRTRTGKLSDVLEVERELTRVRLDIERLDGEKTNVGRRVSYSRIDVTIAEERKAGLEGALSLASRLRVAAADGLEAAIESVTLAALFVLRAGPSLLFWGTLAGAIWLTGRRRLKSRIAR
jgi:hypothetical protein